MYWGLTPQQQPGSYQGGEMMMMMMKSVFWWRKPEYSEETTDLRQGTLDQVWLGRTVYVSMLFGRQAGKGQIDTWTGRQAGRHVGRQTYRQAGRQTDIKADVQTDR